MSGSDVQDAPGRPDQGRLPDAGGRRLRAGHRERNVKSFERHYRLARQRRRRPRPSSAQLSRRSLGAAHHRCRRRQRRHRPGPARTVRGRSDQAGRSRRDSTAIRTTRSRPPVTQDGGSQHLGERTLRAGMKGHDVRVLQGYLTIVGYPTDRRRRLRPGHQGQRRSPFAAGPRVTANGVVTYAESLVLRQAVAAAHDRDRPGRARRRSTPTAPPPRRPARRRSCSEVIAAANQIIDKPYIYGGGHASWNDSGYDCSGSVSYALHGASLLSSPEDSTELESYGSAGPGQWITIYADAAPHVHVIVAGIAFDTAALRRPPPRRHRPALADTPTPRPTCLTAATTSSGTRPGSRAYAAVRSGGAQGPVAPRAPDAADQAAGERAAGADGLTVSIQATACPRWPSCTRSRRSTSTSATRSARSRRSGSRRARPRSTSRPRTRTTCASCSPSRTSSGCRSRPSTAAPAPAR